MHWDKSLEKIGPTEIALADADWVYRTTKRRNGKGWEWRRDRIPSKRMLQSMGSNRFLSRRDWRLVMSSCFMDDMRNDHRWEDDHGLRNVHRLDSIGYHKGCGDEQLGPLTGDNEITWHRRLHDGDSSWIDSCRITSQCLMLMTRSKKKWWTDTLVVHKSNGKCDRQYNEWLEYHGQIRDRHWLGRR